MSDVSSHVLTPPTPEGSPVLGVVAGWGQLPVDVVETALEKGWRVVAFSLSSDNRKALQHLTQGQVVPIVPGLVQKNLDLFAAHHVTHLVFAGKVNKWVLFTQPQLDSLALQLLSRLLTRNDDALMQTYTEVITSQGIEVLPQSMFLASHFQGVGCLSIHKPTPEQFRDITLGFQLAKEMGRLDIGQSVVVHDGMVIAIEAIEGTDACIERAGKLVHRKGGTLVKVAKPSQDQRFDIPTVGLKTLQALHRQGLKVLATEAHETLYLDSIAMARFADRHGMVIVSIDATHLSHIPTHVASQNPAASDL
ncbi:MAG: LpxI family protein [Vampirovibrionales bacterium]